MTFSVFRHTAGWLAISIATVAQVIKALKEKRVTVVTNAINIAMELAAAESIEVVVTGGTLRPVVFRKGFWEKSVESHVLIAELCPTAVVTAAVVAY
jgi:hypothetical protein